VLNRALEVYGIILVSSASPEAGAVLDHPWYVVMSILQVSFPVCRQENAFVCNLRAHWFAFRRFGDYWSVFTLSAGNPDQQAFRRTYFASRFKLDSLEKGPRYLTATFLQMTLVQLAGEVRPTGAARMMLWFEMVATMGDLTQSRATLVTY